MEVSVRKSRQGEEGLILRLGTPKFGARRVPARDGRKDAGGERGVKLLDELHKDKTDRVAVGEHPGCSRSRGGKKGVRAASHFWPQARVLGRQGVGEGLEGLGVPAVEEGIAALPDGDASLAQALSQPVMLIQADAGREWKVRADSDEHPSPARVIDVEVVVVDPALLQLQVPAVVLFVADRRHEARRFTGFEDRHDLIGPSPGERPIHELIAASGGYPLDRHVPVPGLIHDPVMILGGDVPQRIAVHRVALTVRPEEAHDPLRLLERLDDAVQQQAIEAAIPEPYAILMMFGKGVHGASCSSVVRYLEHTAMNALAVGPVTKGPGPPPSAACSSSLLGPGTRRAVAGPGYQGRSP